jgi:cytochrome c oxidase assembly protein subunit 15
MSKVDKPIVVWLLSGCFLVFLMVVVGGITRLTHSGLSMVEWHLFMGAIPPLSEVDWQAMFAKYQHFPEFKELNYDFGLQEFKSIFMWEYIHRLIGRLVGIVFIIPFIYFLIKKRLTSKLKLQSILMFVMGGLQGFLGWYMVKSGLVKDPHVSHFRLAMHLVTAFLTFGYVFWVALGLIYKNVETPNFPGLRRLAWILFPIVLLQIIYGAFVAGLRAGLVYPTFPKMGDNWIAEQVFELTPVWTNFINGLAGVQFIHRYVAYVVVILIITIWWKALKKGLQSDQMFAVRGLLYIVIFQFLLGVFTLLNGVPISLGVMHQVGAFFLLGGNILLIHRLRVPTVQ